MPTAIPYDEPSLVQILVCASFFYLLNVARVVADFCVYGGIVAEIILGVVYGAPLGGILPTQWEETFTTMGYIGLVLLIFEGGLSSNLPMLLSNLPLSIICALTGIGLPIGFSIALLHAGFGYGILEAFAAGAALSSTSLGTTLAALNSVSTVTPTVDKDASSSETATSISNASPRSPSPVRDVPPVASPESTTALQQSRIGTVLISAAIIDDVVGLVIAAVIPALASVQSDSSQESGGALAWTIVRPLLSSAFIAIAAPVVARFVLRPLFWYKCVGERWCAPARPDKLWSFADPASGWGTEKHADAVKVLVIVVSLGAMTAITYSGLVLSYVSKPQHDPDSPRSAIHEQRTKNLSFEDAFGRVFGSVQSYLLLPLFFASIGFAIPFLDLWRPVIIWRGILYCVLMCLAKLAVGLPILLYEPLMVYVPSALHTLQQRIASVSSRIRTTLSSTFRHIRPGRRSDVHASPAPTAPSVTAPVSTSEAEKPEAGRQHGASQPSIGGPRTVAPASSPRDGSASIHAATFMGIAMVARGEIGLLIAQLARGGTTGGGGSAGLLGEDAFLLCIWAILGCTLIGPMGLGFIVRRWGTKVRAGVWA
ncbi:hypothetical protein BN946_scf184826.g1 [Trametes cinnabarina]|uniref:Cation/H+ exchanger transmembrane domain-containing protein n=1 Tax=Pycnoporus cinnabarinus TaxID=5643 RepID=A0A060SV73_PYCCI|nr:hypothetical protein BN946_scf184826.g1 [Trametes cinnabarina]